MCLDFIAQTVDRWTCMSLTRHGTAYCNCFNLLFQSLGDGPNDARRLFLCMHHYFFTHSESALTACAVLASACTANEATPLSSWLRKAVASTIPASVMPWASRVASAMRPIPDIADSTVCSASCTRCCATDKPKGDSARHNPRDAEHGWESERLHANAELGATDDWVTELPGKCPTCRPEVAVSSNTASTRMLGTRVWRILLTRFIWKFVGGDITSGICSSHLVVHRYSQQQKIALKVVFLRLHLRSSNIAARPQTPCNFPLRFLLPKEHSVFNSSWFSSAQKFLNPAKIVLDKVLLLSRHSSKIVRHFFRSLKSLTSTSASSTLAQSRYSELVGPSDSSSETNLWGTLGRPSCAPNLSRQYLKIVQDAANSSFQSNYLVAAHCKSYQIEKVSEYRNAHMHTHNTKATDTESRTKGCYTQRTSKNHRPQHPPYARSSGTPIRFYNSVFWIHFNTLWFTATHVIQRSSPKGSLVHVLDYTH